MVKSLADKHREAGTLDQFRARQAASRASTATYLERCEQERASTLEYERRCRVERAVEEEQQRLDNEWVRRSRLAEESMS